MARLGLSCRSAKKIPRPRGYLAKLVLSGGQIEHQFAERFNINANNHGWRMVLEPGEVAELRGSHWNGERFVIGAHALINNGGDRLIMVDSETARRFLEAVAMLPAPAANNLPIRLLDHVEQILPVYIGTWNDDESPFVGEIND